MSQNGLLIDWLTLRLPILMLEGEVAKRVQASMGRISCCNSDGEIIWEKPTLDFDALRSDSPGLCWQLQSDGKQSFLVIGGSPASIMHGVNVFGSLDINDCAEVLVLQAAKALNCILPRHHAWQCRRIDITGNYALPDAGSVKQALRMLLNTDSVRRKASSAKRGGDTVQWSPTSDLSKGKAYHKGPQLAYLHRQGKIEIAPDLIDLADRLLRLEMTKGARWFRRLEQAGRLWFTLREEELAQLHAEFFGPLVDGVEVKDMGRYELVKKIMDANGVTENQALAAFSTYRNIRADGFEETRSGMARATFFRHLKLLRSVGISDGDLCAGNVVPFRAVRILVGVPVTSWDDLRRVA